MNPVSDTPSPSSDQQVRFAILTHPTQTASIEYPEHWAHEFEKEMTVGFQFQSPEVREVCVGIFMMPYQLPVAELKEDDLQKLLHALLETAGATASESSTLMVYSSRMARTKDGCNTWMAAHEDVVFALQFHMPDVLEHIYRPIFERMLSSFRIHRPGAGERLRLIQDVIDQLRQICGQVTWQRGANGIKGGELAIGVDNLAAMIAQRPNWRTQLIAEFAKTVAQAVQQSQSQSLGKEPWSEVQAKVFPMIRQDRLLSALDDHAADKSSPDSETSKVDRQARQLVASPWLANLIVCYAIDDERSIRLINHGDLNRWQLTSEQLHEQALANLTKSSLPDLVGAAPNGQEPAVAMLGEGGISAKSSYMLHPELYQRLKAVFPGGVWLAMPARDALVFFSKAQGDRRTILEMLAQDYRTSDNRLSDRLFEPTPDGVILG